MNTLQAWDEALFRLLHLGLHRDWLDPFFGFLSYSGLGWSEAAMVLAIALWKPTRRYALPIGLCTALSGILLADGLKALIHRDRPSFLTYALPQEAFEAGGRAGMQSFPSGHAASSFGFGLMVLFLTWRTDYRWLGWLMTGWAAFVSLSRIYRGAHWPTDCLGGFCCGLVGVVLTVTILDRWNLVPETEPEPES